MKSSLILLLLISAFLPRMFSQKGSVQIYCMPDINIYIDNRYSGRTGADMSGLLLENLPVGTVEVRAYKSGYETQNKFVTVSENATTEVWFEMQQTVFKREKNIGMMAHFGTFGLFNVNNDFTKADYSFGFTPFFDVKVHPHLALGFEVMNIWGKPLTTDGLRYMICPNLRFHFLFNPFEKVHVDILIAGGLTYWPSKGGIPVLTPTFNDSRFGWDFRATAGLDFVLTKGAVLNINFGYWAASSTSDDVVWITHDTMLLSLGPKWKF